MPRAYWGILAYLGDVVANRLQLGLQTAQRSGRSAQVSIALLSEQVDAAFGLRGKGTAGK